MPVINNPQTFDHLEEYYGQNIKIAVQDIGAWDMSVDATKDVVYPMDRTKIVAIQVLILSDDDVANPPWLIPLDYRDGAGVVSGSWYIHTFSGVTNLHLARTVGSIFDAANFDKTAGPYNRGYVFYHYID